MIQKDTSGIYRSTLLSSYPSVVHGFSTKSAGDMRKEPLRAAFLAALSVTHAPLTMPQQVHGNSVVAVSASDRGVVAGADGLVCRVSRDPVSLGIVTADCVPMLLADTSKRVICAVHAGWKGTIGNIAGQAVACMEKLGSDPKDIVAAIGPHIGMCCYSVGEDRVRQFVGIFGSDERVTNKFSGAWHVDIGYANRCQLLAAGVGAASIDFSPGCTYCQEEDFFSYRRDSKESFGEMIGVVSWKG